MGLKSGVFAQADRGAFSRNIMVRVRIEVVYYGMHGQCLLAASSLGCLCRFDRTPTLTTKAGFYSAYSLIVETEAASMDCS